MTGDVHPALGGMQSWGSGRTRTLQFEAVTMRAAPQWLSDPGLKSVNTTLLCGEELQLLSVHEEIPWRPVGLGILSPLSYKAWLEWAWCTAAFLGNLCSFFQQVSGHCTEDLGCLLSSQCVLEAPRPVNCSSHTFGQVLLRVNSSKFLLLQKKEQLGKDVCRWGGVSSSPWTQLLSGCLLGKISSHWSMAWSPGSSPSSPIPSPSFAISWKCCLFARVQKWMDGKANLLNLLNKMTPLRNCLNQRGSLTEYLGTTSLYAFLFLHFSLTTCFWPL